MSFQSVLFGQESCSEHLNDIGAPAFFVDLNLAQVVDAITFRRDEYDLKPLFYTPLHNKEAIQYRQQIMQDLERGEILRDIDEFAEKMRVVRRYLALAKKLYYKYNREGWFLEAAALYCDAVAGLEHALERADIRSNGLLQFRDYLTAYLTRADFLALTTDANACRAGLAAIRYCIIVKDNSVKVRKYDGEIDYSVDIEQTFARFQQGAVKDYRLKLSIGSGMNHVEAAILNMVAKLHPEAFAALDAFCEGHSEFLDSMIVRFDREIQFYVSYLEFIAGLRALGISFCYPEMTDADKEISGKACFDLALAAKCAAEGKNIVCNDFYLAGAERIFVVSGPNQGGKTTFARMIGQLHYLGSLGCPVPGKAARLFLYDAIFTHFEQEEDITNLRGKLQDDLIRIHDILEAATPNSIIIMNEIFTSTALQDAIFLSKQILARIIQLDALCVCVTFIEELATLDAKTVSMVGGVLPGNPAQRTYKIERRPADGLSYAISIAEKYRLTYAALKERLTA
ncbi:MAG: DNA mismatch repair protein MutS [Chloroflexota bacterium]|nr:DNA mismatch repair protein MutS [Caldilinea sp.]GIK72967.1 MAG: DNA mismatch repair protein MutS [Chloroflexota bacterium]